MKKLIYTLLAATMALGSVVSCDKFLEEDPRGQFMAASYFNTVEDVQTALARMVDETMDYYYDGCCLNMACRIADDICAANYKTLEVFRQSASEQYVLRSWEASYAAVKQANFVLSLDGTVEGDEKTLSEYMGMAYFYRGLAYYHLVRYYKQMPLILDINPHADIKSSSQAAVWDQVVADLTKAEELLPDSWSSDNVMKLMAPTTWSAKAVLAEAYLNMGGYPYNGGATYYQKAADKAKEIINNTRFGFDSYENIFNDKPAAQDLSKEGLVTFIYTDASTSRNSFITCMMPAEYDGYYWFMPEKKFFQDFPEGPRKDMTFATSFKYNGEDLAWDAPSRSVKLPPYKKMTHSPECSLESGVVMPTWRVEYRTYAFRYTQTALTYAEAIARTSGPDALAYQLMDAIRNRAGLKVYDRGLGGEAFARLVVQERAWEMAGEFTRYSDLCRLQMVEDIHNQRGTDELVDSDYTGTPTKDTYYCPVPEQEMLLNPNLAEIETGTI